MCEIDAELVKFKKLIKKLTSEKRRHEKIRNKLHRALKIRVAEEKKKEYIKRLEVTEDILIKLGGALKECKNAKQRLESERKKLLKKDKKIQDEALKEADRVLRFHRSSRI